jgi:integrase
MAQRKLRLDGIDPLQQKRAGRDAAAVERAKAISMRECATAYVTAHQAAWKGPANAKQWEASLATYVYPSLGALPVRDIDVGLVMRVVEPLWAEKPETANRVRRRIEAVLDWATARGHRVGENPARWRGHLETLLPARGKVQPVEHHAALPYAELGAFVAELRQQSGTATRALELLILTAARSDEVLGATWAEIDLANRVWTIPAERMKSAKEHRVPLSDAALAVLGQPGSPSALVFPSARNGKRQYRMTLFDQLRRMGRGDLTAHGFRSSFRDWAAERSAFPAEVAEMALAHSVGTAVERSYRRGDLFDKRRQIMDAWARYCAAPSAPGEVVALRR